MSEIIIEEEVAAILKPRRMRTYTPEELERKRERLRVARERKKSLTEIGQESPETALIAGEGVGQGVSVEPHGTAA